MSTPDSRPMLYAPMPGVIRQIAVPASVGFFFQTMYNVVDQLFAKDIGTQAQAALALSFPVFFIIISFSVGLLNGTTAIIANELGRGDRERACLFASQALSFGLLLSVGVTFFGWWVSPALFRLLGANSPEYLGQCLVYMNVIFGGASLFILVNVLNAPLNANGDTVTFRNALIAGFFLNLVFNPMLLYGWGPLPAMGLRGIALATVLIQALLIIYIGGKSIRIGLISRRTLSQLIPRREYFVELTRQALPASLNMVMVGVGIMVITGFVGRYGEAAAAAYGVATRIEQLAILPAIGLNLSALSIAGQNYGAGRFERIGEMLRLSHRYGLVVSLVGALVIFIFADPLLKILTRDPEVIRMGRDYLRIAIFVFAAYTIVFINVSTLIGMKKPGYVVWIGIYRQIVAPLLVFYVCTQVMGWGLLSIWWGTLCITWSGAALTMYFLRRELRTLA